MYGIKEFLKGALKEKEENTYTVLMMQHAWYLVQHRKHRAKTEAGKGQTYEWNNIPN